jgi:Family of unknown function (DUF6090)
MLLRRLAHNLKEQNWTAIWIEFVLLVVGVFLGIQVANWNATQQDHRREAEFIARLDRDFQKIDARLADNISRWELKTTATLRVLADLDSFQKTGSWPRTKAEMLADLNDTFNSRIPAPRSATYIELLSAGQLGLIRNTKLRDALLEYAQVGYSMTGFDVLVNRVEPFMGTVVAHLEYDQTKTNSNIAIETITRDSVWSDVNLERLAADLEVKTAMKIYAAASRNQLGLSKLQRNKAGSAILLLRPNASNMKSKQP